LTVLSSCDRFEKRFYAKIDQGQINAIKNGADTFDLSTITDFKWDSVLLYRGNESVPEYKEIIEDLINNRKNSTNWEERRFKNKIDTSIKWKTTDLPTYKDRFYFLTSDKKIIEKEIESGICSHKPAFDLTLCQFDSIHERLWMSRQECKFILKSNSRKIGDGTVFLYPKCNTKFHPDSLRFFEEKDKDNKNGR
jgi:hypothetical protein